MTTRKGDAKRAFGGAAIAATLIALGGTALLAGLAPRPAQAAPLTEEQIKEAKAIADLGAVLARAGKGDYERAKWDPIHFKPAIDYAKDEACLVCFPGMVKTLGPAELAGTVKEGPRWHDLEITPKATVRPTPQVAVIAYEASARRGSDAPYRVAVSSGYVERGGKWKLAWHQQTPL